MKTFITSDEELKVRCVNKSGTDVVGTYYINDKEVFSDTGYDDGKSFCVWLHSRPQPEQIRWIKILLATIDQIKKACVSDIIDFLKPPV